MPVPPINPEVGSEETTIDAPTPALGGLSLWLARRKLVKAEKTIDELDLSSEAHKEMADVYSNLVDDEKKPGRITYRSVDPSLFPNTPLQKAQDRRAADRMSEVHDIRSGTQYRMKATYPELSALDNPDLTQEEFDDLVEDIKQDYKETRGMSIMDLRRALKAVDTYVKLSEKADKLERKVRRSATGDDIPGRLIRKSSSSKQEEIPKLQTKVVGLALRSAVDAGIMSQEQEEESPELGFYPLDEDEPDFEDEFDDWSEEASADEKEAELPSELSPKEIAETAQQIYLQTKNDMVERVKQARSRMPNEALPRAQEQAIWSDEASYREEALDAFSSADRAVVSSAVEAIVRSDAEANGAGQPGLWARLKQEEERSKSEEEKARGKSGKRARNEEIPPELLSSGRWSDAILSRISGDIHDQNSRDAQDIKDSLGIGSVPKDKFTELSRRNKRLAVEAELDGGKGASEEDIHDLSEELYKHFLRNKS
jgi:hypothetical protein